MSDIKLGLADGASAHDLWYAAFGQAFRGVGAASGAEGRCEACHEARNDVLAKGRYICVRCDSMSMKKPKAKGSTAGPQDRQVVLITAAAAVYTAGNLARPPGLPPTSRLLDVPGDAFLARVLYAPPPPPFLLLRLDRNSDPVLNQGRVTRHVGRMYLCGTQLECVDQRAMRVAADALRQAAPKYPARLFAALAALHAPLWRGPGSDAEAWSVARERLAVILAEHPPLVDVFDERGHWPVPPGTAGWSALELLVRNEGWTHAWND